MARRSQRIRRQRRIEKRKAREEAQLSKTIEDNSVILERMKNMSKCLDEVCENITTELETENKPAESPVVDLKGESSVEMRIQPFNEPTLIAPQITNFKKMTKKQLIEYAKENNIVVKSAMTKAQMIKAIEETI